MKYFQVRFHHPHGGAVEMRLNADTTFGEIMAMLHQNGFLQKKTADYAFILHGRVCALNKPLSGYILPETEDITDIEISGALTIMT
jgi:hypothetical protein